MLALASELTQTQATNCLKVLLRGLKLVAGHSVVLDASALAQFDSAALAVMLELRREATAVNKSFAVLGLPPRLADLAALYGIDALLPTMSTAPTVG